jgi:hypothetical protein
MNWNLLTIKIKAVLSSAILVLFALAGFSGIGLFFAPSGREARVTNWTFMGFSRSGLETLHDIPGLILVALLVVHFILNLKLYINEIKILFK